MTARSARPLRAPGAVFGAAVALSGCAFGPGEPFAVVEASAAAGYAPLSERALGDGFEALDGGFELRLADLRVGVEALVLEAWSPDAAGVFDPAAPPAGFQSCSLGVCRATDGRAVAYADMPAELGGAAASPRAVLVFGPASLDAQGGASVRLDCGAARCELGAGYLGLARLELATLTLSAEVRDAQVPSRIGGPGPAVLELALDFAALGGARPGAGVYGALLDATVDRDASPRLVLGVGLAAATSAFDGLDARALLGLDGEPARSAAQASLAAALDERWSYGVTVEWSDE
ncbi:MAG: hypothetical protein IT373_28925 [Polyangiaceae bacterium]|nr:hypothetical protein [Polyangiaceae bacterium]